MNIETQVEPMTPIAPESFQRNPLVALVREMQIGTAATTSSIQDNIDMLRELTHLSQKYWDGVWRRRQSLTATFVYDRAPPLGSLLSFMQDEADTALKAIRGMQDVGRIAGYRTVERWAAGAGAHPQ